MARFCGPQNDRVVSFSMCETLAQTSVLAMWLYVYYVHKREEDQWNNGTGVVLQSQNDGNHKTSNDKESKEVDHPR